jgi:carbamoyl-phosphate synthase large subunit
MRFAEMASTGEVAAFGRNMQEAYFNATMSVNGFKLPKVGSGVLVGGDIDRPELGLVAKGLSDLGFKIFCSSAAVEEHLNSIPYLVRPEDMQAERSILIIELRVQSASKIFFPVKDKGKLFEVFENAKSVDRGSGFVVRPC